MITNLVIALAMLLGRGAVNVQRAGDASATQMKSRKYNTISNAALSHEAPADGAAEARHDVAMSGGV